MRKQTSVRLPLAGGTPARAHNLRPGQIALRPMMYLALSYDHRVIDGAEAVTFLVKVKEAIEDPQRIMLEM